LQTKLNIKNSKYKTNLTKGQTQNKYYFDYSKFVNNDDLY